MENPLPAGYAGKRADVVFALENLIAEVKSFTSDRRQDPQVATKLGEVSPVRLINGTLSNVRGGD